jgi:type IV secretion system protein VirB3
MRIPQSTEVPFPLFKGATRAPTVGGVPMIPLMCMLIVVATIAMMISLWCWFLALPLWFVMAQITKNDDRAFRIWGLWFDTKCRNSNKIFWGASTYSKRDYRCKGRR